MKFKNCRFHVFTLIWKLNGRRVAGLGPEKRLKRQLTTNLKVRRISIFSTGKRMTFRFVVSCLFSLFSGPRPATLVTPTLAPSTDLGERRTLNRGPLAPRPRRIRIRPRCSLEVDEEEEREELMKDSPDLRKWVAWPSLCHVFRSSRFWSCWPQKCWWRIVRICQFWLGLLSGSFKGWANSYQKFRQLLWPFQRVHDPLIQFKGFLSLMSSATTSRMITEDRRWSWSKPTPNTGMKSTNQSARPKEQKESWDKLTYCLASILSFVLSSSIFFSSSFWSCTSACWTSSLR